MRLSALKSGGSGARGALKSHFAKHQASMMAEMMAGSKVLPLAALMVMD